MRGTRQGRANRAGRSKAAAPNARAARGPRALLASRAFAPALGLWGAALGALAVMVMPSGLIASFALAPLIARAGLAVQPAVAGGAGLALGSLVLGLAALGSAAARRRGAGRAARAFGEPGADPIDPLHDLGPPVLAAEELAAQSAAPPEDDDAEPAAPQSLAEGDAAPLAAPAPPEAPAPMGTPDRPAPSSSAAGTRAPALLRSIPTSELTMPEMVERFALALHDRRAAAPSSAGATGELAQREAALAEALKALAALSETGGPPRSAGRDEPLRAALAQLGPRQMGGQP